MALFTNGTEPNKEILIQNTPIQHLKLPKSYKKTVNPLHNNTTSSYQNSCQINPYITIFRKILLCVKSIGKLVLSYIIHHNSGSEGGIKTVRPPLYTHNTPLSDGNKIYSKLKCLQLANLQQTMVNSNLRNGEQITNFAF